MADWLLNGVIEWLAERVQGMLGGLVSFLTAAFFTSPDVTGFPQVQLLVSRSSIVVNAAFVLAIIVAGAVSMTHGTFQIRYEVKDLIPRLVFGFVASNFGVELCRMLIETANALTLAMVGETASGPQVIEFVKARIVSAMKDPSAGVDLLLSPDHNIPILLLGAGAGPTPSTDVFNLFIAACLLAVTVRIPKLVGRYITRAGQMSTAGVVLRAVIIQSITRRLRVPLRRPGP